MRGYNHDFRKIAIGLYFSEFGAVAASGARPGPVHPLVAGLGNVDGLDEPSCSGVSRRLLRSGSRDPAFPENPDPRLARLGAGADDARAAGRSYGFKGFA